MVCSCIWFLFTRYEHFTHSFAPLTRSWNVHNSWIKIICTRNPCNNLYTFHTFCKFMVLWVFNCTCIIHIPHGAIKFNDLELHCESAEVMQRAPSHLKDSCAATIVNGQIMTRAGGNNVKLISRGMLRITQRIPNRSYRSDPFVITRRNEPSHELTTGN